MADQALAPVLVDPIGVHRKKPRHLGLDRLHQHLPSPFTQHAEQRVVLDRPSWPGQPDDGVSSMAYPSIGDFIHHRGYAAYLIPQIRP